MVVMPRMNLYSKVYNNAMAYRIFWNRGQGFYFFHRVLDPAFKRGQAPLGGGF